MALRVLLLQSDLKLAHPLARYFTARGDTVWQVDDLLHAINQVEQIQPNLILMDLHFESADWITFLRRVRQEHPGIRIIMTNKFPDLQREMMAREQNVQVFLRQPFSARWIEQALKKIKEGENTQPLRGRGRAAPARQKTSAPQLGSVRVPVRVKITLPYLVLALLFAMASAYVVSQVVLESVQDRFMNQLVATGKQSTDWMVREERRLLETLRLVANTQGVADAIQRKDAEALRGMVLPVVMNSGEEAVEVLDMSGVSVLSLRRPAGSSLLDYKATLGDSVFLQWDFVKKVAAGQADANGDKFSGSARAPWGDYFYVSGPVRDQNGNLAGIVLVGKSLQTVVRQLREDTMGETTLYDVQGTPLASTLFTGEEVFPLDGQTVQQSLAQQDNTTFTRDVSISSLKYTEILAPWEARGGVDQGVMGISLAQSFILRTSQATEIEIFILVTVGVLFVLMVGLYLANLITRPLVRLVKASSEVAQGNLEIKVDASGDDEVAVLAQSFNYMVAGLQEGSIYRDLLGRTVSPEVREQLRQTFTSGRLRLEGQQAVATVLMSDIRGFTPLSEKSDPATVFQWLNEYFAQMVPCIALNGGVVNKFDGDAILAFFGILPRMLNPRQSAAAACQAALEILQAINNLNELRVARGELPMITGIGVHTGLVIAGGLGTSDRLHYTIIGDTVNSTQRIESLTRDVMEESGVLISQATYNALGDERSRFNLVPVGERKVKGKEESIFVYRLIPGNRPEGNLAARGQAAGTAQPAALPFANAPKPSGGD